MYKVYFFVPERNCEEVKNAMFEKGAGKIGNYDCCSFQTSGLGQFRPNKGSNPYIGEINRVEKVKEFKVEMICSEEYIVEVIKAMKNTHPYEEVAFEVIKMEDIC